MLKLDKVKANECGRSLCMMTEWKGDAHTEKGSLATLRFVISPQRAVESQCKSINRKWHNHICFLKIALCSYIYIVENRGKSQDEFLEINQEAITKIQVSKWKMVEIQIRTVRDRNGEKSSGLPIGRKLYKTWWWTIFALGVFVILMKGGTS